MFEQKKFLKDIEGLPEDIIIENQRGISFLGYPFFSSKLLFARVDPSNFQIINLEDRLLKNISNEFVHSIADLYPLTKTESKCCVNSTVKWFVLMDFKDKLDMDDQGWLYSWHFNSFRWKSKHGIVRRRVWVKLPDTCCPVHNSKTIVSSLPVSSHPSSVNISFVTANNDEGTLLDELKLQIIDRKKFELLDKYYETGDITKQSLQEEAFRNKLQDCFQYNESKQKFIDDWLPNKLS